MPTERNYTPDGIGEDKVKTYTFFDALREVSNGRSITKLEWKNNGIYGKLVDNKLYIHIDNEFKQWIISDGDLLGTDWVVLSEQQNVSDEQLRQDFIDNELRCSSCGVRKGEEHKDWCEDDLG